MLGGPGNRVDLFDMGLDAVTRRAAVAQILDWCGERPAVARLVVTPNLQHAVVRTEHEGLAEALAGADLVLADGQPLVWASWLFGQRLPERVAGSDLVPELFERTQEPLRVFLLGGRPEVAQLAERRIVERWPLVDVVGVETPPPGIDGAPDVGARLCETIAAARPELLLVALGCPTQETWLAEHRDRLQVCVAVAVGATIDFLAGTTPRAPKWMRTAGLEWTHRALLEPRRLLPRYLGILRRLPWLLYHQVNRTMRPEVGR